MKHAILALLLSAATAPGAGIIVGHTNIMGVTNYSQATMDTIGQFKWFFSHASVGGNMMDGISDLHGANADFYQLISVSDDSTPPATAANGHIYEYMRGNPGWQAKFDLFTNYVIDGWRQPKVNLALDKLCYIDPAADVDYYINGMTNLENRFPDTVIVYATIPLTTDENNYNYLRQIYNQTLRGWIATNNRVLFDIADIEAHGTDGTEYTFTYNETTCQRLYDDYSSDGGHLNALGAQQVAKGFYAIGYALLNTDRDADGMSDGREIIAGMCPTNGDSVFEFSGLTNEVSGHCLISWKSASNRYYSL